MKLKIELRIDGTTISGRELWLDEDLRRTIDDTDFLIRSGFPLIFSAGKVYVSDKHDHGRATVFCESYDSLESADNVYKTIISLVNELNGEIGGVVDEMGNALYIDSHGETISVISPGWGSQMTEDKEDSNHMKIYISGKITDNTNYTEEFAKAEKILKEKFPGATIINPAEVLLPNLCDWDDYMVICLRLLDKATHIYMLDNWVQSRGACTEHLHALENDIKVLWSDNSPYRGA